MAKIERLNRRQEDALQAAADRFVDAHDGDIMKALKAMMLLNKDLQEQVDALQPAQTVGRPNAAPPLARQKQFTF
ncbi:hypothetical protein ACSBOB_26920 [Mesorhizobium sp. ASY16-5R]|uniref:hypothetical protein n=1 Tax=Mesorhizobium sp. ASY16-5R TaxID=3445772 RepID=UPI003FA07EAD